MRAGRPQRVSNKNIKITIPILFSYCEGFQWQSHFFGHKISQLIDKKSYIK